MKRIFITAIYVVLAISVSTAQTKAPKVDYVDATQLTILGKLCETTNPYHRVEVATIPELNKSESRLLRQTSGLAVAFKTDASAIYVKAKYGTQNSWGATSPLSATTGFNLFIKDKNGEFIDNCAHISIFTQDYTFGRHITYMFNRVIDPNLITGVVINETVFPVEICDDPSVRMEMLPKTKVFNWEEYQEKMPVVEITS